MMKLLCAIAAAALMVLVFWVGGKDLTVREPNNAFVLASAIIAGAFGYMTRKWSQED